MSTKDPVLLGSAPQISPDIAHSADMLALYRYISACILSVLLHRADQALVELHQLGGELILAVPSSHFTLFSFRVCLFQFRALRSLVGPSTTALSYTSDSHRR